MTMSKQKKKEYAKNKDKESRDKWYATLTEAIEGDALPWRKPWRGGAGGGIPRNLISNRHYQGGNSMMLLIFGMLEGWEDMRFGTRKNLIEAGFSIEGLKNGTGFPIKYFKRSTYEEVQDDGTIETKQRFLTRWYEVFNVTQCKDYTPPETDEKFEPVPSHQMMEHFNRYIESQDSLTLERVGSRAFYRSSEDLIRLPKHEDFTDSLGEVMTAFHEAAHSTGHKSRCERPLGNGFGSSAYAFEELIAEMSSMLVVMNLGGEFDPSKVMEENANSVAYLQHWLKSCADQDRALDEAFHKAQQACNFILDNCKGDDEQ